MNSNSDIKKGRGRPKEPGKVAICRRVTPEQKDRIDELLGVIRKGGYEAARASGELVKVTESLGRREPEVKRESPVMVHVGADKMLSEYKNQNRMLLDDIQRLTDQVASLERELEECRNLTYDEKMACWKERALRAEAYAATKNE